MRSLFQGCGTLEEVSVLSFLQNQRLTILSGSGETLSLVAFPTRGWAQIFSLISLHTHGCLFWSSKGTRCLRSFESFLEGVDFQSFIIQIWPLVCFFKKCVAAWWFHARKSCILIIFLPPLHLLSLICLPLPPNSFFPTSFPHTPVLCLPLSLIRAVCIWETSRATLFHRVAF